jgi:hypothetical protein
MKSTTINNMPQVTYDRADTGGLLDVFIQTELALTQLPHLSPLDRVTFDHDIAISHLYYSSKIEGTTLNKERLEKAVRPQNF